MIDIENDSLKTYWHEIDSVKKIHIYNQYLKRDLSENDNKHLEKIKKNIKNLIKKDNINFDKTNNKYIDYIEIIKYEYKFKTNKKKCKNILI
jgi:hypothetical protein